MKQQYAFVHFLFCRPQLLRPIVEEDDLTAAIGKRIVIVLFEVKMLLSGCCSLVGAVTQKKIIDNDTIWKGTRASFMPMMMVPRADKIYILL